MTFDMIQSHAMGMGERATALAAAFDALAECAQICGLCADACLAEEMVADLRGCIRLNLDCADVCIATAQLLVRELSGGSSVLEAQLEVCVAACRACAVECEEHARMHEHCRLCAESCRRCEQACEELLAELR